MKLFFIFLEFFACNLKYDLYNADIRSKRERKREKVMREMVFFVSDCCNVESDQDHEVCSACGEHCEIITEVYENDYIPGYDDGEAC